MESISAITLLRLHLSKRKRLSEEIIHNRLHCERTLRRYRHYSNIRNKLILSLLVMINNSFAGYRRQVWSFQKNEKWWEEIVPAMTPKQFKENFRVERSTFLILVEQMGPHLRKINTNFRCSISIEKKICCALYTLGSSSEFRTVGNLFGIGKSTAAEILHHFCEVMVDLFFYRLIKFPNTRQEIDETIEGFLTKSGYPMCLGSLDGTHLSVKPPTGFESDYFNYKKFFSIIMLAVVNAELKFTYVNVGAPGRSNDSSVYTRSTLSEVIHSPIYENHFIYVNNLKVRCHLVADSAFPLDHTLMKPYAIRPNMDRAQATFNYRLSRCRCTVERAFGLMKNRFRSLHKKMEFRIENVINIIKSVALLHNICISNGDLNEIDWDIPEPLHKKPATGITTTIGLGTREALTHYFTQNPL